MELNKKQKGYDIRYYGASVVNKKAKIYKCECAGYPIKES